MHGRPPGPDGTPGAGAALLLVIGNRNYSSWSLRPWLALAMTGAAFETLRIPLYQPDTQARIRQYSAAGKVPVLVEISMGRVPLAVATGTTSSQARSKLV
jgi:hypothetical protein